jgi:hypothetical protein
MLQNDTIAKYFWLELAEIYEPENITIMGDWHSIGIVVKRVVWVIFLWHVWDLIGFGDYLSSGMERLQHITFSSSCL